MFSLSIQSCNGSTFSPMSSSDDACSGLSDGVVAENLLALSSFHAISIGIYWIVGVVQTP